MLFDEYGTNIADGFFVGIFKVNFRIKLYLI